MKKIIGVVIGALLFSGPLLADTTTSRFGLTKPDVGSTNWGPKINTNSDVIDNAGGLTLSNSWTNTNTFSGATTVSGAASFTAGVTLSSNTTVSGPTTHTGATTFSGAAVTFSTNAATVSASTFTYSNGSSIAGTKTDNSTTTFTAGNTFNNTGNVFVSANSTFTTVNTTTIKNGGVTTINNSSSGVGILGTNTNDSASSGFVGEYISSACTSINVPTTDTYQQIISINLTAGDWDLSGMVLVNRNGATFTANFGECFISANSGTSTSDRTYGVNDMDYNIGGLTTFTDLPIYLPRYRVSLSGSATYYLKTVVGSFTGGPPKLTGSITARRVR